MQAHVGPSEWALLVLSITSVQTCTHRESSIVYTGNIQRKERIQQYGGVKMVEKNFLLEFQLARYVQMCQYIKRTLCKKLKDF